MDLKTIQNQFKQLGCLTVIEGNKLYILEDGNIDNEDIAKELDKLPKPEFKWESYVTCGETQFEVTHRRFLKGWW